MDNSKKQQQDSINNNDNNNYVSEIIDYNDHTEYDEYEDDLEVASSRRGNCNGDGISRSIGDRLSEIIVEESDGDLLIQETSLLEWIQALDLQHVGACRADERLKPLLKVNGSGSGVQDCLLSYLSQHFQASEVGLLARCLCVPLVSMRVGKVEKRGSTLCPTSVRGNLNITLLPSSDLCISFFGDDGQTERLVTLGDASEYSALVVEEIPADQSGRSFLMKLPDGRMFYFWCSEKSKLLGNDLLLKMKDLIKRKPTLAELTGISESRLESVMNWVGGLLMKSRVVS